MVKLARVLVVGLLVVLACNPEQPRFAFKHAEKRGKLEANGLRFVLMPDPSTPLVNVAVRWDVGSREDPPGKAGLAHVVEHLMFQPRPDGNNSPPLFQSIINLAVGGDMNAYTNTDTTHYYETVRGENLDDAIKIEAMRQFYFMDTITDVEFERERDVVRNEERQNYSNPIGELYQAVVSTVYPKGHAYAKTTIGDDLQISSITLADAKEFVKKYYAPERATVLVAGGFEPDAAVASIQKWFGKLPKRAAAPRRTVDPITLEAGTATIAVEAERPMVGVAFAMPPSNTKEGEAARFGWFRVFGRTLQATSEWEFATDVTFLPLGGELAPVYLLVIELKSMDKLDEALDWVKSNCKQAYRGFDDGGKVELEEEENLQKADFIQGLERLGSRTQRVADLVQFGTEVNFDSSELYVFHELDKFSKFDGAFVVKTVKKYIDFDKARVVVVKPTNTGKLGDTVVNAARFNKQEDEAIVNPDVDPAEAMHPIKVKTELKTLESAQHIKLDNGMNVIMLPMHGMPLITAAMAYTNAGAASTPQNPALATAAAEFLHLPFEPGTESAYSKTGINVRCGAGPDDMECETDGISLYLDVMLNGLERIISTADYNQEAIEKWQKDVKTGFQTKSAQEDMEFLRQRLTAFYGADHPYTVTALMTPENANKVHKDALDDFRRSHYAAGNATLVIVGDFDPKDATSQVKSVFGSWSRGAKLSPVGKATAKRNGPVYIGVVAKEEPQITLTMGYPAPGGIDGQQAARLIVGDLMQYRVDDIRFKLGTTYGMGAGRRTTLGPTAYQIRGRIDAARAGESLKAIRDGIDALRTQEFDVDFVRARRKELHNLMGGSTVTGELTDELVSVARFGLDAGYYGKLATQIGATPPALIKALIKTELDPNNEIIVIKGSRSQIEKTFADAGIKDVKIVEPDYK